MDEPYLYRKIYDTVRQEILDGVRKPGDKLPPVREMARQWGCTVGTVQRAYSDLARQGLVTSRAGQGTHVVDKPPAAASHEAPLRRAALIHRAEAFLLEVLTTGYAPEDVEAAVRQALDRWRSIEQEPEVVNPGTLRFSGSHDLAITWLAGRFYEIAPGCTLQLHFTGSLGGLLALAEGHADIAGCHLWDEESDTYNIPFVRRIFPGQEMALITLAHRRLGLILPAGNPKGIQDLSDMGRAGLRFANRQPGSGTRVWLDAALRRAAVDAHAIQGYSDQLTTHSAVAMAVAEGRADAGIGLEAAAYSYGLDFILLTRERYDLVAPAYALEEQPLQFLLKDLSSKKTRAGLEHLGGYDTAETGQIQRII